MLLAQPSPLFHADQPFLLTRSALDRARFETPPDGFATSQGGQYAVKRLLADGPAAAVKATAEGVDLAIATRTTARTTLLLLQLGGDLLDTTTATASARWLLDQLADPSAFVSRTRASDIVPLRLLETLSGVIGAADEATQLVVIDRVATLPAQSDDVLAAGWAELVRTVPDSAITTEPARRLAQGAERHNIRLHYALLGRSALHDDASQAALVTEAEAGSIYALEHLSDVRVLSTAGASKLISNVSASVTQAVANARNSSWSIGGEHNAKRLVILNHWHPAAAAWAPIVSVLAEPMIDAATKCLALGALAPITEAIPDEFREQLVPLVSTLSDPGSRSTPPWGDDDSDVTGAATEVAVTLGALDESTVTDRITHLLAGDPSRRTWAAGVCGRLNTPHSIGVLLALSQDDHYDVRAAAGGVLAYLVATGRGGDPAINALRNCLTDPGCKAPATIATFSLRRRPGRPRRPKSWDSWLNTSRRTFAARIAEIASVRPRDCP